MIILSKQSWHSFSYRGPKPIFCGENFITRTTEPKQATMEQMFNAKTVRRRCIGIDPTPKQITSAKKWLRMLDKNELVKEEETHDLFTQYILVDLLGYEIEQIKPEKGKVDYQIVDKQNTPILCIERKGSKRNLKELQKGYPEEKKIPVRQAYEYQSTINSKYSICTNHDDFILLDRDYMLSKAHEFNFSSIKNNPEKLKEFIGIFSNNSLTNNNLKSMYEESIREQNTITNEFYNIFHQTRLMLLDTYKQNGMIHNTALEYAQLFLNRLVFFFFAADKGFITNSNENRDSEIFFNKIINELKSSSETSRKISNYIEDELFEQLNKGTTNPPVFGFNGGLFDVKRNEKAWFRDICTDKLSEVQNLVSIKPTYTPQISKLLKEYPDLNPIIRNLLALNSYDFKSEISINILGHIFEQSVDVLEELSNETNDLRKNTGVFYTPEYITNFICNHTIIPYLSKNNATTIYDLMTEYIQADEIHILEKKLDNIRILDPACGSGAFLIQAAQILLDIHKAILNHKEISDAYPTESLERWTDKAKTTSIIESNIYGVDISERSVEIAKLSIFFKIATEKTKLPVLGKNIVRGDSLLPADNLHPVDGAFDWHEHFPEIMDQGGFDVIIGNPPYVRHEKIKNIYKNQIKLNGRLLSKKTDLSGYFYFRTLDLLKPNGIFSFISSDTWMSADYGFQIRELFLKHQIISILRPSFRIFEDADTTPSLLFIRKNKKSSDGNNIVQLVTIAEKINLIQDKYEEVIQKPQNTFSVDSWNTYFKKDVIISYIKMTTLEELCLVKFGIKTGQKDYFILDQSKIKEFGIDKKYLKPLVPDEKVHSGRLEEDMEVSHYMLDVNQPKNILEKTSEGRRVIDYLTVGETTLITPTRGNDKTPRPISELPTCANRKLWYSLNIKSTPDIFLSRIINDYPKVYENMADFQTINTFAHITPKNNKINSALLAYFASSIFALQLEKIGTRMGGGGVEY
ncbi:MAG: N-6 DNA methylase [Gammaproteobacteria bacterium]|nr:N-6 DNA methylase [Gammaproteobacteria bacterium]